MARWALGSKRKRWWARVRAGVSSFMIRRPWKLNFPSLTHLLKPLSIDFRSLLPLILFYPLRRPTPSTRAREGYAFYLELNHTYPAHSTPLSPRSHSRHTLYFHLPCSPPLPLCVPCSCSPNLQPPKLPSFRPVVLSNPFLLQRLDVLSLVRPPRVSKTPNPNPRRSFFHLPASADRRLSSVTHSSCTNSSILSSIWVLDPKLRLYCMSQLVWWGSKTLSLPIVSSIPLSRSVFIPMSTLCPSPIFASRRVCQ